MKNIRTAVTLLLFAVLAGIPSALGGVSCSLPFNLTNGTTADATQVMANYNALVTCLSNAASAGANNDITSLNAISTPITPAQGGTPVFMGSNSTGTNTQVVATTTPSGFALLSGKQVTFVVGSANTAATTLTVGAAVATNFFRRTQLGISAMVGGELIPGHQATAYYDGTEFILTSAGPYMVGEIKDFGGAAAPAGWEFIDGSCQVRTTQADLFTVIGTAYDPTGSTCDSAHFALPDGRGRMLVGNDSMGINGAAGRITSGGSGCSGNVNGGAGCGAQTHTLSVAEMPSHNHSASSSSSDSGHQHGMGFGTSGLGGGGTSGLVGGGNTLTQVGFANITTSTSIGFTGGNGAHVILNPLQVVSKIIKY